jgi:ribosomal protein L32
VVTAAIAKEPRPLKQRTAKRLRKNPGEQLQTVLIVTCPQCGDRYSIAHQVPCPDPTLAERNAAWLQDRFVWDHIQESRHRGSILLPD